MGWQEELKTAFHSGEHFFKTDGVRILQQANLQGLHKSMDELDYENVQEWALRREETASKGCSST